MNKHLPPWSETGYTLHGHTQSLAGMRTELFERIRAAVATWGIAPVHVSVFGSTARGDGNTDSDVDLFIVRPSLVQEEDTAWRAQVDELAGQIQRWTGNHAGIAEAAAATAAPGPQREGYLTAPPEALSAYHVPPNCLAPT